MKFLVCLSRTPDTSSKIAFESDNKKLKEEGISYILNPYDEWYALVRAIELKEKFGGTVDVAHVGNASSEVIIRKALAIGADAAVRFDAEPRSSFDVAHYIADFARDKAYDIILLGKETIDHNGSETGALLSELLDLPYISYCSKLEIEGTKAITNREIEGGVETSETALPILISSAKGLAEQRIPNMKGIMDAKKKPLDVINVNVPSSNLVLENYELAASKSGVKMIAPEDINELIRILHEEAKVI